jgi:transcriptional regulator with XRE-family HTH domain
MTEEFSARVTRAMKMAGLNQNQLSLAVDVAPTTIADMRRGKTEPKYTTVFKIAEALAVDPVWLATGKGSPQATPSETLADLTEVSIVGAVQAGVFSETLSFDGDVQLAVPKLPFSHIFGLEVRGDGSGLFSRQLCHLHAVGKLHKRGQIRRPRRRGAATSRRARIHIERDNARFSRTGLAQPEIYQ